MSEQNQSANSRLEQGVHICLIGVCLASLGLLAERRFAAHATAPSVAASEKALLGKHVEVAGIDWRSSSTHAVLYMNTNCHFCQESTPFYREITDARRTRNSAVSLSVFSAQPPEIMRQYLANEHIQVDGVYKLSPSIAGLTGTPTWLILDASGIVRRVFIGKLDWSKQKELLKIVQTGTV